MAGRSTPWSISPIGSTGSSQASCRLPRLWRWSTAAAVPPAPTLSMSRTRSPISTRWACAIARWRSWRAGPLLAPRRAVGEDCPANEAQLVARLLDREAEAVAQHHPALLRMRHGERIEGLLPRPGRQGRQLAVERARALHAIGGIHRHHPVCSLG